MLGKMDGEMMIFADSFALPVEGAETRVNTQAAACESMAKCIETTEQVGRLGNAIGWFHGPPLTMVAGFLGSMSVLPCSISISRSHS